MDCLQTRNLASAYLDRELDLTSTIAMDRHLESCAGCRSAFDQQSSLSSAIREHAVYHTAPAALADRIRAAVATTSAERRPNETRARRWQWPSFGHWFQMGAAIAATATITWTAALQLSGLSQSELIADQVVSGHARSVVTGHLADVATSDQHTVKPWLSSKLDFSPAVVDLTQSGFPLIGGRVDYLDHRPVAALVYARNKHVINLFVWPDDASPAAGPMQTLTKNGYNVVHWSARGMAYWAISDVNAEEIKDFARKCAAAT